MVAGGFIEVGVGRTGVTPTVEAYSPESNTWRDLPDLPRLAITGWRQWSETGRSSSVAIPRSGDASTSVWELVDDVWVDRAPVPEPVAAGAAVVLGQAIHVVGWGTRRALPPLRPRRRLVVEAPRAGKGA